MNAFNHLTNVITTGAAFVPVNLTASIVAAAAALGVTLCGGIYDPETQARALYVA